MDLISSLLHSKSCFSHNVCTHVHLFSCAYIPEHGKFTVNNSIQNQTRVLKRGHLNTRVFIRSQPVIRQEPLTSFLHPSGSQFATQHLQIFLHVAKLCARSRRRSLFFSLHVCLLRPVGICSAHVFLSRPSLCVASII